MTKNETIPGKTAKLLSLYSKSLLVPTPPHQKPLYLYRPFTISRMKERGGKGNSIPFPSAINTEAASEKRRRKGRVKVERIRPLRTIYYGRSPLSPLPSDPSISTVPCAFHRSPVSFTLHQLLLLPSSPSPSHLYGKPPTPPTANVHFR